MDCLEFIRMRAAEIHVGAGGERKYFAEIMSENPPKLGWDWSLVDTRTPISLYRTNVSAWDALVSVPKKMNLVIGFDDERKMYFHPGSGGE